MAMTIEMVINMNTEILWLKGSTAEPIIVGETDSVVSLLEKAYSAVSMLEKLTVMLICQRSR